LAALAPAEGQEMTFELLCQQKGQRKKTHWWNCGGWTRGMAPSSLLFAAPDTSSNPVKELFFKKSFF